MKWIVSIAALICIGGVLWWTVAPAFIDHTVEDELPAELATAVHTEPSATTSTEENNVFTIIDTPGHPASGNIRVITTDTTSIVRFENYDGTNGPDLYIYLSKDLNAEEFVSLGRAKGNQGNINYAVPENIDINDYQYVITWCRAFGVLFDYALINP